MKKSVARIAELDALRGIAVLSVILYHYTSRYNDLYQHKSTYLLNFTLGRLGVQLFFIISGFVIFMTLERCSNIKQFIIKRMSRLYPAYIVSVTLTFTIVSFVGLKGREASISDAIFNLTISTFALKKSI